MELSKEFLDTLTDEEIEVIQNCIIEHRKKLAEEQKKQQATKVLNIKLKKQK